MEKAKTLGISKRLLSIFLLLTMLVSIVPAFGTTASAETRHGVLFDAKSGKFTIGGAGTKTVQFYVDDPEFLYFAPQGFYKTNY